MDIKKYLKDNPLEYSLPLKETRALEKVFKLTFRDHGIDWNIVPDVKVGRTQYFKSSVWGYTHNFAKAYAHIGLLYAQKVLPIWESRHKKKK